jgi:hypothetical protein
MNRRRVFLVTALIVLNAQTWAADFDRRTFLAAVKDRIKAEPKLMTLGSVYDPILEINSYPIKTEGWQKDLMTIPGISLPSLGQNATFGVALAYLASQELGMPFSGRRTDALIILEGVDEAHLSVVIHGGLNSFGNNLLPTVFDDKKRCSFQGFFRYVPAETQFANSICNDLKRVVSEARSDFNIGHIFTSQDSPPQGRRNADPGPNGRGIGGQYTASGFQGTSAEATARLERLNKEKSDLLVALGEFGEVPTLQSTTDVRTGNRRLTYARSATGQDEITDKANANSAEVEKQLPILRDELKKRRIEYAKQAVQKAGTQLASAYSPRGTPLASRLDDLKTRSSQLNVEIGGVTNDDDVARVYQTAKLLNAASGALAQTAATRLKAEKAVASAKLEVEKSAKWSGDDTVASAVKSTTQTVIQVVAKLQNNDPSDEPQISALADRLTKAEQTVKSATQQVAVLSSGIGKRVNEGCTAWAKRRGMITSAPVRVFKGDATNQAADLAANMGTHLCRCMTTQIVGDREITDEAKLEIARQFETRDRMDNQALAVVVAASSVKCQAQLMDEVSGGDRGRR